MILDTYNKSVELFIGGLMLIASFAWRDVIVMLIDSYFKISEETKKTIKYKVIYAFILTFVALVAAQQLKDRLSVDKEDINLVVNRLTALNKLGEVDVDKTNKHT